MLRWYLSRTPHFFSDWLWPYCECALVPKILICLKYFLDKNPPKQPQCIMFNNIYCHFLADEEALMLPKRSSSQFKSSSIISGFERARLSPSHFPTLLEEQLLIYKRPGSVESLESFDPVNSVSDHVMSGAEAASKAEAVEESKFFDREKVSF